MRRYSCVVALAAAAMVWAMPGCGSYEDKRQAARVKWERVSAQARVTVARDLFESGRFEDAFITAQQCLQADPELAEAHLIAGKCLYVQGRQAQAQSSFIKAVGFDERLGAGWFWLGEVAMHDRQPAQAVEHYGRAVSLEPMNIDYIVSLVEAYAELGRYDEAFVLLEEKRTICEGGRLNCGCAAGKVKV